MTRLLLALICLALAAPASVLPAVAAPAQASLCHASTVAPPKARERKPVDGREKKRPASPSLSNGCIGCIVPLDGISSTMALAPPVTAPRNIFQPTALNGIALRPVPPPPRPI